MRHFLTLADFTKQELLEMISLAQKIKKQTLERKYVPYMQHKTLGMIFEKSSTRTRVSFETGIYQLGGIGLFLSKNDIQLGRGEPMKDTARVISRMVDMVMIRTFEQSKIEEFAAFSKVPVINGLTDSYHPVQLLTDYLTMIEFGKGVDPIVAYVGDGNNMAHSLLNGCSKVGMNISIASPSGYKPDKEIVDNAKKFAKYMGSKVEILDDPVAAVKNADIVYTDVWASMGQEAEAAERRKKFMKYQVNPKLVKNAKDDYLFMHCLPAHRGDEVVNEVADSVNSVIFDEAENRLHVQKAIMALVM